MGGSRQKLSDRKASTFKEGLIKAHTKRTQWSTNPRIISFVNFLLQLRRWNQAFDGHGYAWWSMGQHIARLEFVGFLPLFHGGNDETR